MTYQESMKLNLPKDQVLGNGCLDHRISRNMWLFYWKKVSVINRLRESNLSWIRVQISYHRVNNLAEILNRYLAAKIGQGIFSKELMDRKCNCSLPSKVNGKCVYEGTFRSWCIIYGVKRSMCDAIYIGNTQKTFKKRMNGHFSDLQRLLKNG